MNNGTIDLQRNGFIATLVINRPAKLNALTPEMLEQLLAHCHTLETDSEINCISNSFIFCVKNAWIPVVSVCVVIICDFIVQCCAC